MTTLEKSRKLALLAGDLIEFYDPMKRYIPGEGLYPLDLYAPANMALAWRVLNWATDDSRSLIVWGHAGDVFNLAKLPPEEALATWLDAVLTLAIEAGMVE